MFCNKCGKFIKDDTDFCPECGNKIVRETKVDNNVTFCNQCGKKIEGDTVFCPGCGNKIVSNTVTPTVTTNNTFQVNTNVAQRNISNVNTNVNQVPYKQPVQPQYQAPTQNQYYANQYNNQYTYRKKSSGGGIGAFIVLLLVGFLGFKFIGNGGDVIIDQPIEPNGYEETPPTQRGGSGKTVLNIENRLFNKRINSSSDVLNYIREDGETKRKSCPSEIKSIEEKIQSEFGITAVNLCEIDVNFAKGLYEGVKWAYQQFPQIRGKLTNLTIANMENMGGTIAYFRPIFDFIYDG